MLVVSFSATELERLAAQAEQRGQTTAEFVRQAALDRAAGITPPTPISERLRERARQIAARLKEQYGAERVLLFGSAARGTATEHSDLDLLIITPSEEPQLRRRAAVRRLVDDLSRDLALSPIVLTEAELEKRLAMGDHFFAEVVQTGIAL
jgi:predicted nucleotidyltransferase